MTSLTPGYHGHNRPTIIAMVTIRCDQAGCISKRIRTTRKKQFEFWKFLQCGLQISTIVRNYNVNVFGLLRTVKLCDLAIRATIIAHSWLMFIFSTNLFLRTCSSSTFPPTGLTPRTPAVFPFFSGMSVLTLALCARISWLPVSF